MKTVYKLMKINRLIKNHRIKFAYVWLAHIFHFRHLFVRLDPVFACNLRCKMCHFSIKNFASENKGIFTWDEIVRIAGMFFSRALQLSIGCRAEPTLYKEYSKIVKLSKEYGIPHVSFVTNGILLNDTGIRKFIEYKLDEVIVSCHGVKKETYEYLMPNASHERFIETLKRIHNLKKEYGSPVPRIRINYTVNPLNLDELEDFFHTYGVFDISTLQIRPVADWGDTEYKDKDITPYIEKYKEVIAAIGKECQRRNIVFLATLIDPTLKSDNVASVIIDAIQRLIVPNKVWRPDFNFKEETYDQYCKRIGWGIYLFRCIFLKMSKLKMEKGALTYEIID